MIWIACIQKVEFRIPKLILPDPGLEFRAVSSDETGGFVDDVLAHLSGK